MGGTFAKLIPRNSVVPCRTTETFSTGIGGQTKINIRVFQGERAMVADNKLLGDFTLEGIPPEPRGVPKNNVTFDIDANSIVHVSTTDQKSGKARKITIKDQGGLSEDDVFDMIEDAEEHAKDDEKERILVEKKQDYEHYVANAEARLAESHTMLPDELVSDIKSVLQTLKDDLKTNNARKMNSTFLKAKKLTEKMQEIVHDQVSQQ